MPSLDPRTRDIDRDKKLKQQERMVSDTLTAANQQHLKNAQLVYNTASVFVGLLTTATGVYLKTM